MKKKQLWEINLGDGDTIRLRAKTLTEIDEIITRSSADFTPEMVNWARRIPEVEQRLTLDQQLSRGRMIEKALKGEVN